ncbi:MAG: molybdopterin-guanine dinucleotide biosynthesis protein B [Acidobacteriota bacterium]
MNIFTFTGWSGSGKTTLISKLINELSRRGWKVMGVKKVPEKFHLEPEGKDSRKFMEHGAKTVYLVAERQLMKMSSIVHPEDFFKLARKDVEEHDFVLIEGLTNKDDFIFEVYNPEISKNLKTDKNILNAVISKDQDFKDIKWFNRDDIENLANHLEILKNS